MLALGVIVKGTKSLWCFVGEWMAMILNFGNIGLMIWPPGHYCPEETWPVTAKLIPSPFPATEPHQNNNQPEVQLLHDWTDFLMFAQRFHIGSFNPEPETFLMNSFSWYSLMKVFGYAVIFPVDSYPFLIWYLLYMLWNISDWLEPKLPSITRENVV